MDLGLEGRSVVVTGATVETSSAPAGGIGAETARLLVDEGAQVVLADIDAVRGRKLAEELREKGGEAIFVRTDVTQVDDVRHMVDAALKAHGAIDGLVTAAGCRARHGTAPDFPSINLEDWHFVMDAHLTGTLNCIQEVSRSAMIPRRSGKIVTISSNAGHGLGGAHPYGVAMAAISYLTKGVAAKLGPYGIHVNCVSPGPVLTPIWEFEQMSDGEIETLEQSMLTNKMIRLERPGTGRDIAKVVLFLLSDLSWHVTAADINATAGLEVY
jgi:NAD(P)-dependent dehydrogenase (short-subunit alcohol dehydrogenase family)